MGFRPDDSGVPRPIPAMEPLLQAFRHAGAERAFIILREGKWDIPGYLKDGQAAGIALGYLMTRWPFGQPFTLDAAYPFLRGATVLLGFPDIVFAQRDAFRRLVAHQSDTGAEVVLGVCPTDDARKWDMVDVDGSGRVLRVLVKPGRSDLRHGWFIAAWSGTFTEFLHSTAVRWIRDGSHRHPDGRELYMGDVLTAAIEAGLRVEAVSFQSANPVDIGTPHDLLRAVREAREVGGEQG